MSSGTKGSILPLAVLLAAGLAFTLAGCGRREAELSTGQTMTRKELPALPGSVWGDTGYAVVRRGALSSIYGNFRSVLSHRGIVKWDGRFDCNRFATLYIAVAHTDFAVAAWHSSTGAQSLALAEIWYLQGGDRDRAHAIVAAMTEDGLIFIEPQTGKELVLTPAERQSIFLTKW